MLCTRMQLTDRRFRIKSSISYQNGECESSATVSNDVRTPFVRPCAIIKMFNCDNSDGKEAINTGRSSTAFSMKLDTNRKPNETENLNKTDVHGSQPSLNR